jgi:dienelactone hydrolase
MKTPAVIIVFLLITNLVVLSQPYPVGNRQMSFTDPARSRTIATRVYHPAAATGSNQPFATGAFPLIILGHGFSMSYDAYLNFADSLVPLGYIIIMPTTEVGPIPFPSHENFALDLSFLNTHIKGLNGNSGSVFYQHVASTSAIMGHSMGGGCSFLACAGNSNVTTMVTFAPAETNTSAITAAAQITIPALVFSGQNDGVTKPSENHIPMYNNLASDCKTFVNIIGGGHCYYALSNWACDFGESTSSPQPTITREQQQQVTFSLLIPYLNNMLKNDASQGSLFMNRLQTLTTITYQRDCLTSVNESHPSSGFIYPVPFSSEIQIPASYSLPVTVKIYTISGIRLYENTVSEKQINLSSLEKGLYLIEISDSKNTSVYKAIKN